MKFYLIFLIVKIDMTFHPPLFPSFPLSWFPFLSLSPSSSKAKLNDPWHKNLWNHISLSFPLFHNPQPHTLNSHPPSCSPRLPNPTHWVSSSRNSLCPSNPWTRLDFLKRVGSPLAPLILSWNLTAHIDRQQSNQRF